MGPRVNRGADRKQAKRIPRPIESRAARSRRGAWGCLGTSFGGKPTRADAPTEGPRATDTHTTLGTAVGRHGSVLGEALLTVRRNAIKVLYFLPLSGETYKTIQNQRLGQFIQMVREKNPHPTSTIEN